MSIVPSSTRCAPPPTPASSNHFREFQLLPEGQSSRSHTGSGSGATIRLCNVLASLPTGLTVMTQPSREGSERA
jgi:hypothetical protein